MEKEEFSIKLEEALLKQKICIDENEINKFYNYMNFLIEQNKKVNLTAIIEPNEIIKKHFLDSLLILEYIKKEDKVIDIGTGAGFPGIPINIIKSNNMTLLDSLNKRIVFLKEIIEKLELKNVIAIHGRAEEFSRKEEYREKYDIGISRAVAKIKILAEYVLPFIRTGGIFICMKGPNLEEMYEGKESIERLGGKIIRIDKKYLENNKEERNMIIIEKIKKTPTEYPRKIVK